MAAPQAATPGFTQSAVDPSQLLSLLTGLGQNIGGMA